MRRFAFAAALLPVALVAAMPSAEAQSRRRADDGAPLVLNVRPRSFLDPGPVVPQNSLNRYAFESTRSYLTNPPYINLQERYGGSVLPDPVTNAPFAGGRNPFGPIDFEAPPGLR
jgi:hypothetical protein